MLRGEFIVNGDLVIPNNITTEGAAQILAAALRNQNSLALWGGLCSAVYQPGMTVADIAEPTIGVGGYGRKSLPRDDATWTPGEVMGEPYVESIDMVWTPAAVYDKAITRMFICFTQSELVGPVFCLSGSLPAAVTLNAPLTSRYRVYLR